MATDYTMDYAEIKKQHGQLTEQLDDLSKQLAEMQNIEETLLTAGQWNTADKKELTDRFGAYIEGGRQLHDTGVSNAETLSQVAARYQQAEQG